MYGDSLVTNDSTVPMGRASSRIRMQAVNDLPKFNRHDVTKKVEQLRFCYELPGLHHNRSQQARRQTLHARASTHAYNRFGERATCRRRGQRTHFIEVDHFDQYAHAFCLNSATSSGCITS